MTDKPDRSRWQHATLGLELVGVLLVMIGLGHLADRWLGSEPWGILIGAFVGIVGGLYKVARDAMRIMKQQTSNKD